MTKIGFIGAGQMATALASGFLKSGVVKAHELFASDVSRVNLDLFVKVTGASRSVSNKDLLEKSKVVFLAVKPQYMGAVLDELNVNNPSDTLFVSIAAGLSIAFFEEKLGKIARIIRVMPNTPCLVGKAASAYAVSSGATEDDVKLVDSLLKTVGIAEQVPENLMDVVTGLSGSGPAYVYMLIEALSDGAVKMGLPRSLAMSFAAQTVKGAAEMVLTTGEHPGALKDQVTSPAGTTIAGVKALEDHGFRAALIAAVEAATNRSRELSNS